MTQIGIAPNQTDERAHIEQRLSRLRLVENVRRLALPIAAGSAVIGVFIPPVFPIGAGIAAAALGVGEFYMRAQRKALGEEIKTFEDRYGTKEGATLSSSANRITVGGPSG
jgi:hypothetical protein